MFSAKFVAEPVTPTDLVAGVRAARGDADAAELRVYELALAWCDAHPVTPGVSVWHAAAKARHDTQPVCWLEDPGLADMSEEEVEWFGLPEVAWDAPAGFAAANAMTTTAGRAYLRDALVLRHRLPALHRRVVLGLVPVWRARRVAAQVLGEAADVVAAVDAAVADRAGSLGPVQLSNLIDGIRLELHTEAVELAAQAAREARYARLDERAVGIDGLGSGLGCMDIRADLVDLVEFDRALSQVAAALADTQTTDAPGESLDVRRARAVGILADPATALELLNRTGSPDSGPARRRVELVVHLSARLSARAVTGTGTPFSPTPFAPAPFGPAPFGPVTHPAQDNEPGPFGHPFLTDTIREWCSRPGTHVTIRPVLDPLDEITTDGYRPTTTQTRQVRLRDRHCVFPRCTRPARDTDADHVIPYDDTGPPGQTFTSGLAPTCRHHHRLKTHAGWRAQVLAPGMYLWRDPHGQVFLRCPDGTTHDLTDTDATADRLAA